MAKTLSTMIPLGTIAPDFQLPDVSSGEILSLSSIPRDKALVIMFICNHCPFVIHVASEISRIAQDYAGKSVNFIAICSNDASFYPEDAPDKMKDFSKKYNLGFPYLHDESQNIAKAYQAVCTPDFFIYEQNRKCVYRGQLDNSRPGNGIPCDGSDLRKAINALLHGKPMPEPQKPSVGCNIKWKP